MGIHLIIIRDTLAGQPISFRYCETKEDLRDAFRFARRNSVLAFDTEATHWDCYRIGWKLRTFQFGDDTRSYVVPATQRNFISAVCALPIKWIGHNGNHDKRSINQWLGYDTKMDVPFETFILAHHYDPRNRKEGGVNHGLKEQCVARVDPESGKWEKALKAHFKTIRVPIPGQYFRSGKRKDQPKDRVARINEGWSLVDPRDRTYIAYAGSDPILTYRLAQWYQGKHFFNAELYESDWRIADVCSRLQIRGMLHDRKYTARYVAALTRTIEESSKVLTEFGITSAYATAQIAECLMDYGVELTEKTPTGKWKVDTNLMKAILAEAKSKPEGREVAYLLRHLLKLKRCSKRLSAYAGQIQQSADSMGRIHPSINSLGAVTSRMSVSNPAFQQLPTKED